MSENYEDHQAEAKEEENDDDTDSSSYSFPSYTRFTFTGKTKSRLGRHSRQNRQAHAKNETIVKEDRIETCSATNEHNANIGGLTLQAPQTPNLKWIQSNNTHPVTHPFTPGSNTLREPNYACENDSGIDISSQSNFLSFLKNDSTCKRNLGFNNTPFKKEEKQPTSLKELNNLFQKTSVPSINFVCKSKDKGKENNTTSEIAVEDPWNKFKRICDLSAPQPPKAPSSTLFSLLPRVDKPVEAQNSNKVDTVSKLYSSDLYFKKKPEHDSPNVPLDLSTNENLSGNKSIFGKNSSTENDSTTSSTASATTVLLSDKPENLALHTQKLNPVDNSKEPQNPDSFSSLLPTFLVATNKTNFVEPPQVILNKSPPYSSNNVSKPHSNLELKSSPQDSQTNVSKLMPAQRSSVQLSSGGTVLDESKQLHRHPSQSNFTQTLNTVESKQHQTIANNITSNSKSNDSLIPMKINNHHLGIAPIKSKTDHYQQRTGLESSTPTQQPYAKLCDPASTMLQNNHTKPCLASSNLSAFSELNLKCETSSVHLTGKSAEDRYNNTALSNTIVRDKPSNIKFLTQNNPQPNNLIQSNIPHSSLENQSSTPPSLVQSTLKISPESQDKFTDDFNQPADHVLNQKTYLAPIQPPERRISDHVKTETPGAMFSRPLESVPAKRPQNCFKAPAPRGLMSRANTDLYVNGKAYTILSMLGRGGSSEVFQVIDPRSSKLLAVKCVDLSMVDKMIADGYLNEIDLLSKLQGCASVIRMFDYEYVQEQKMLYVVMEKGDTDLSHLIRDITMTKKISMSMIIYYWTEMLNAVKDIHDQGIIHSDLKPANFLLVSGRLKLIDFGIASSQGDMTSVVKEVTTGTWNYMSPEALRNTSATGKGFKITYKSDVWSLGCILYNLVYGKTPFAHITNTWAKLQAIADPNHQIEFPEVGAPPVLTQALKSCLQREPVQRPTVAELISLPYHSTSHVALQIRNILSPQSWLQVKHLFPEINSTQDEKDLDESKKL